MNTDSIQELQKIVTMYRDDRDWKQFHGLKNLAASISVESGELLEHFLWTDESRWPEKMEDEVADIFYSLLLFCDESGINLGEAFLKKLEQNAVKYPIVKAKGSPKKYTDHEKNSTLTEVK